MSQKMNRRMFLRDVSRVMALAAISPACQFQREQAHRPNIILFLSDDQGYGDVGCYGNSEVNTPVTDLLAKQGVRFTAFYANAPECTPTRTALLTGRYQQRVGGLECAIGIGNVGRYDDAVRLRKTHDLGLPVSETSIPRMLKNVGYHTAIVGKWHLGYEPKFSPNKHGFDYAFYVLGGWVDYFHHGENTPEFTPMLYENEKPITRKGYLTDLIGQHAIKFIDQQQRDHPFFLYIPFTAPHAPYQGPDDYLPEPLPADSPLHKQGKGPKDVYAAMIERMDQVMGKILDKLREKNLSENTLVIFMSDNGASGTGSNAPFRGGKGGVFEGGIRVPCVVRWPGHLQTGMVYNEPCMTMDFSASIVRIAGTKPPSNRPFDGIDVLKYVEGHKRLPRRNLFWRKRRGQTTVKAVRSGDMKYIYIQKRGKVQEYLFDLKNDPADKDDLLQEKPKVAARMRQLLANWEKEVKPIR